MFSAVIHAIYVRAAAVHVLVMRSSTMRAWSRSCLCVRQCTAGRNRRVSVLARLSAGPCVRQLCRVCVAVLKKYRTQQ